MYPDVHFLGGKLVTVREVDVTTKAHQRHEGSPYSPFEITPRRRFSTTSGKPLRWLPNPHKLFRGKSHGLIPLRRTPTAQESPTSKSNKITGNAQTFSNLKQLGLREGEGDDLSFDWNNTQRGSQMLLGSRIWCKQMGVREKYILRVFQLYSTTPTRGGGDYIQWWQKSDRRNHL